MMNSAIRIAVTGSIGMGKSTVCGFFSQAGVPVWDADETVHRLYAPGAKGSKAIAELAPDAVGPDGVDREVLSRLIAQDSGLLNRVETVIHPLVAEDRARFLSDAESDVVVFDIPLLFEGRMQDEFDYVVVVSASARVQEERVLSRPGMTTAKFETILARQMPDAEKRKHADYVVDSSGTLDATRQQVLDILSDIRARSDT